MERTEWRYIKNVKLGLGIFWLCWDSPVIRMQTGVSWGSSFGFSCSVTSPRSSFRLLCEESCKSSALTPHTTSLLHKDACLEREWGLLTRTTQNRLKEENGEARQVLVHPSLSPSAKSLILLSLNPGWCPMMSISSVNFLCCWHKHDFVMSYLQCSRHIKGVGNKGLTVAKSEEHCLIQAKRLSWNSVYRSRGISIREVGARFLRHLQRRTSGGKQN